MNRSPDLHQRWSAIARPYFGQAAYTAIFCLTLVWFNVVDFYHTHFATTGVLVIIHNAFRILFIFYLFWLVQTVGAIALRPWLISSTGVAERLALTFSAGSGIWHLVLLALGYLGLYVRPVAAAITIPVAAASYPAMASVFRDAARRVPGYWKNADQSACAAVGFVLFAMVALLLTKGLYPAGGHDYYTHYFPYYRAVIDQHGVWPNDVWYHYYYSKGDGLFFLGMLLADPLAPQLVTYCFMIVAALILFLAVREWSSIAQWATVAAGLFLAVYVFTPAWAEFEKDHEFNTALVLSVVWLTGRLLRSQKEPRTAFFIAAISALAAAVIINVQIGVYFAVVFCGVLVLRLVRRDRPGAAVCMALGAWSCALVVSILAVNYATTGLILDQGILQLWRFADVEALYRWGALPNVLNLYAGTASMAHSAFPLFSLHTGKLVALTLRLDLLGPLVGIACLVVVRSFLLDRQTVALISREIAFGRLAPAAMAIVVALLVTVTQGRTQPVSIYRYSTFVTPVVLLASIALLGIVARQPGLSASRLVGHRWAPLSTAGLCVVAVVVSTQAYGYGSVAKDVVAFAIGEASLDDAYVALGHWPYHWRPPISAGVRSAYGVVGPDVPIWSLHVHTYCMLPGCRMQTFMSVNMSRRWDRVMFGPPDEAEEVLKNAGINYFLFARDLQITDPIPLSALFSPDGIADRLGVRWTDGTTTLLTWRGPDAAPIDAAWLAAYRQSVESSGIQGFPIGAFRSVYETLYATPHPWHPIPLPW